MNESVAYLHVQNEYSPFHDTFCSPPLIQQLFDSLSIEDHLQSIHNWKIIRSLFVPGHLYCLTYWLKLHLTRMVFPRHTYLIFTTRVADVIKICLPHWGVANKHFTREERRKCLVFFTQLTTNYYDITIIVLSFFGIFCFLTFYIITFDPVFMIRYPSIFIIYIPGADL